MGIPRSVVVSALLTTGSLLFVLYILSFKGLLMLIHSWMKSLRNRLADSRRDSRRSRRAFVVSRAIDTLEPRTLLSAISVTSNLDTIDAGDGVTTLREAIIESNAMSGTDLISFGIVGPGPHSIHLTGPLPVITEAVEIDGSNQDITIDASTITSTTVAALTISGQAAAGSFVHNLTIAGVFSAVEVVSADDVTLDNLSLPKGGVRQGYGITVRGSSSATVSNSTVSNRWLGVRFLDVTTSLVADNSMAGTSIADGGASGFNTYLRNDVSGVTTGTAIGMFGSLGHNTIDDNNASNSGIGVEVRGTVGNRIVNNDLSSSSVSVVGSAITIRDTTQVEISGNDFSDSSRGVRFYDVHDVVITPTGVSDPRTVAQMDPLSVDYLDWMPIDVDLSTITREALQFVGVSNLTIDGLSLPKIGSRSGTGIYIQSGTDVTVRNTLVSNRTSAVFFKDITYSEVVDNHFVGNGVGQSGATGHVEYRGNEFSDMATRTGITLWGSIGHNLVTANNLSGSGAAVDVRNGPRNQILANDFSSSSLSTNTAPVAIYSLTDIEIADNDFTNSSRGIRFHDMRDVVITPAGASDPRTDEQMDPLNAEYLDWLPIDVDLSTITREAFQFYDASNVTIDGFSLSRTGSRAGTGIYVENSTDVTVRNSEVLNRPSAVIFKHVTDSTVENNVFRGTSISESGTSGFNNYSGNDVSDTFSSILLAGTLGHSVVEENDLSFARNGITVRGGRGNQLLNNNISNVPAISTGNAAILLRDDTEIIISGNDFSNSYRGVRFEFLKDVIIAAAGDGTPGYDAGTNTLSIDVDLTGVTSEAMILFETENVTVEGFDLSSTGATRTGTGLRLWDETNTTVRGVTVANRSIGISPTKSTNVDIHCSTILDNTFGVNVGTSTASVTISESHLEGNSIAVRNVFADPVTATGNYWGAPDGPSNLGGSGDSYSGNVDASSFLATLPDCLRTNLPPDVSVDAAAISFGEGSTATNSGTWSDVDVDDVVTLAASTGALVQNGDGTWDWSFDTNDGPDQTQTVIITATDAEGETAAVEFGLTVLNVAPDLTADAGAVEVSEGQSTSNGGTFGDAGLDTVALSASAGTVVDNGNGTWDWSFDTNDGTEQSQPVTITAVDSDGASTELTFGLTVANVAPMISILTSSNGDLANKSDTGVVSIDGSFFDPGLDTHTVSVDWGDGSVESVSVDQLADVFSGQHDYDGGGIFQITVSVTDSDGAVSVSGTTTAVITGVGLVDGTLFIVGTDGRDHVNLKSNQKKDELKIDAKLNQGGSDGGSDGGRDRNSDRDELGNSQRIKRTVTASAVDRIARYCAAVMITTTEGVLAAVTAGQMAVETLRFRRSFWAAPVTITSSGDAATIFSTEVTAKTNCPEGEGPTF
ncbi:MAG: parallel beta-helix repeat protein [Porticoccaceae bacterium]